MAETIELEVVTPERPLVHEDVESVDVPGKAGYLGILPGHAALVGEMGTGVLHYAAAGKRRGVAVSGGFLEVQEGHVRILADVAELAEEIDLNRAKAALAKAQQVLAQQAAAGGPEAEAAAAAQDRATARINAAEGK